MKKYPLLFVVCALFLCSHGFAQVNPVKMFTLKGNLHGAHVDSVIVYYPDSTGKDARFEKPVDNNTFSISGYIKQPALALILFKQSGELIPQNLIRARERSFYIDSGAVQVSGDPADIKNLVISGSQTETESEELAAKTSPIMEEMKPTVAAFQKEQDHEKKAALHDQLGPYQNRIKKVTYQFFLDHPNSYLTAQQMRFYVSNMGLDSSLTVYNGFNAELKATAEVKEVAAKIKEIESGMPGSMAHGFTKVDINGKTLSLSDFKGKYVILDFWASWCVPCRKSNPHMIELYNKYKSKNLDVIGIADDDGKIAVWNDAVTKDGVGIWHQVLRGLNPDMIMKRIYNPGDMDELYGVTNIPTKILIDPNGKIIGRYGDQGGTDEDMDKKLESIFNY
jgi:thiol-disulfide isomerase/thioredoxin